MTKPMTDKRLRERKKTQATLSQGAGALGLAGLGALGASKLPKPVARQALKAVPKSQRGKVTREKVRGLSTGLVTTGAGVGGIGSLNFATIQSAEARKRNINKADNVSAFGVVHPFEKRLGEPLNSLGHNSDISSRKKNIIEHRRDYKTAKQTLKQTGARSSEIRRLQRGSDKWSARQANVARVRRMGDQGVTVRDRISPTGRSLRTFKETVDNAPTVDKPLYRGAMISQPHKRGETISMKETSWSGERDYAERWAKPRAHTPQQKKRIQQYAGGQTPTNPAVYKLKPGARAVDISRVTRYKQAEHVSPRSDYRVTNKRGNTYWLEAAK